MMTIKSIEALRYTPNEITEMEEKFNVKISNQMIFPEGANCPACMDVSGEPKNLKQFFKNIYYFSSLQDIFDYGAEDNKDLLNLYQAF